MLVDEGKMRIFVVMLVFGCLPMAAQAQQGTITGVVEAGGQPLVGVVVGAQIKTMSTLDPLPAVATGASDESGAFRLTGLKPGKYILMILSSEWVTIGDSQTGLAAREVEVKADEAVTNLKLDAVKGGVITGRVMTQEGQPIIGVSVNIAPAGQAGRRTVLANIDRMVSSKYLTDDRGIYRIYGLQPGRYLISAGSAGSGRDPIPMTYYPDGSEKGEPVTVREKEEVSGIDLVVRADEPAYIVQGRLTDIRTGTPVPNVSIKYVTQSLSGGSTSASAAKSDSQGAFVISGLRRGVYKLIAGGDQQSSYHSEPLPFDIVDQDVTGLEIKVMASASISGAVVIEGESSGVTVERPSRLNLRASLISAAGGTTSLALSPIASNGEFKINGLGPGRVQLSLIGENDSSGWWVTGITSREGLITDGIPLQIGEQVSGVKIVVKRGTGQVKGSVIIPGELLRSNIRVRVVAQPAERGAISIVNVNSALVGNDGTFEIAGLLPGPYVLRLFSPDVTEQVTKMFNRVRQNVFIGHNSETSVILTINSENQ